MSCGFTSWHFVARLLAFSIFFYFFYLLFDLFYFFLNERHYFLLDEKKIISYKRYMRINFIFQIRYLIFHRSHARRNFIFNEEILFSKSKQISIFTEVLSEELEELEHNRTGRKWLAFQHVTRKYIKLLNQFLRYEVFN